MADKSNIQWCDGSWNIARGCTKVDSDCKFCYMMRDGDRWGYDGKAVVRTKSVFSMPLRYKETKSKVWDGPPLIFTSSLTDFFHPDCDSFRDDAWHIIRLRQDLIFQILTKRPERIKKNLPPDWYDQTQSCYSNVWFGTSIGHVSPKSLQRVLDLQGNFPSASIRFLSIEPLHGFLPLSDDYLRFIKWIIVGGESGNKTGKWNYRPCRLQWIEHIIDRGTALGIPVFVKQLGTHLAKEMGLKDPHGGDISEWPEEIRVRQMPNPPNFL